MSDVQKATFERTCDYCGKIVMSEYPDTGMPGFCSEQCRDTCFEETRQETTSTLKRDS